MDVTVDARGDHVCEHGTAVDVHCCGEGGLPYPGCHSGFLFDLESCSCTIKQMSNPYIDQSMAKVIEVMLRPHLRDGENCASALERILRERDLAIYDAGRAEYKADEIEITRRVFCAACLSQPDQTLRISRLALAAVDGPHSNEFKIKTYEDLASNEAVYVAYRTKPDGSTYTSQYDR